MAWVTPKTDWATSEYFLLSDWNRIVGNAQELYNIIGATFPWRNCTLADTAALPYYDIVNNLESNLSDLKSTFGFSFIEFVKTTWYARTDALWTHNPSAEDFSRWESLEAQLYYWRDLVFTQANTLYSGTFYAGSNRALQRFSRGR